MELNTPAKTYLVGEYSVLVGGAALGIATEPYFKLNFSGEADQINPNSAAGLYLKKNNRKVDFSIQADYKGGFGKSTAEYLAAITPDLIKKKSPNFSEILKEYKSLHNGSGIDLAFQYFGKITLADFEKNKYESYSWPFADLSFFVVTTGLKVATHEHIKQLDLEQLKVLPKYSDQVIEAFKNQDKQQFLSSLKKWCDVLKQLRLTHESSLQIIDEVAKNPDVILTKPCGALGADVLLVFCETSNKSQVLSYLSQQMSHSNLKIVADESNLGQGYSYFFDQFIRGSNVG